MRSFGIRNSHIPGLGRQQPRPGPVAFGDPRIGALIAAGADPLGRFGLDQLLHHQPDRLTDQIHALTGTERLEQLGYDRLGQRHRWDLLVSTCPYTPRIPPMAPLTVSHTDYRNPTTPGTLTFMIGSGLLVISRSAADGAEPDLAPLFGAVAVIAASDLDADA